MINQSATLLIIISFITFVLGFFVFYKNPKGRVNRSFALMALASLIWINSSYFEDEFSRSNIMDFLLKLDFSSASLFAFSALLFCLDVTKSQIAKRTFLRISVLVIPLVLTLLIFFTKFIISGYEITQINSINPILNSGKFIYNFLIFFASFVAVGLIIWKYKKSSPEEKSQFVYLFIGFFLTASIAFITNVFLTNFIQNSPNYSLYSRLGTFSVVFLILASGYAIVKHRLLNLKIITTELLSLGILVFSLFQVLNSQTPIDLIISLIVFLILVAFIIMLIRSVENEVKRKEELQLMSNKLAVANDQLRKLDNSKSEFISIASHQLRTPLTAIKGFVSLLLEGAYGKLMGKQEEAMNKVYTSNERLIHLVEDLLNISRMESGRMEFKFAPAKMEDICQEIIDTFVLRAKEKSLYLHYKKPEISMPELMIDAGKVKEVVSNMVDNALKYTPKGGVTLKLSELGDKVRVTVSDTGIGIPATELPYLFNKFSRGKDIGRLNTGGTGLGLYVGKGMIENNGGKIWAESDGEGKGSRFIIELPVKQSAELLQRWG